METWTSPLYKVGGVTFKTACWYFSFSSKFLHFCRIHLLLFFSQTLVKCVLIRVWVLTCVTAQQAWAQWVISSGRSRRWTTSTWASPTRHLMPMDNPMYGTPYRHLFMCCRSHHYWDATWGAADTHGDWDTPLSFSCFSEASMFDLSPVSL